MRRIGVGLISVGLDGRGAHPRLHRHLPYVYPELRLRPELIIAADAEPSRVGYATDVLGYAAGTLDYAEVLADERVDVVSICSPNFLHAEMGVAAARAGKHFWIEKPVGRGVAETAAVAAAVAEARVITSVGFNYRHAPVVEHLKTLIADGRLGSDHQRPGPVLRRLLRRSPGPVLVALHPRAWPAVGCSAISAVTRRTCAPTWSGRSRS